MLRVIHPGHTRDSGHMLDRHEESRMCHACRRRALNGVRARARACVRVRARVRVRVRRASARSRQD